MTQNDYTDLSDEELLKETKWVKSYKIYDGVIFGFLVGVAIYSSVTNGFGLLTFLPLIYLPVAKKNNDRYKKIESAAKERNLP
ncbi:MAG: FUSC family protein [Cryomorphaceae bacterium]